MLLNQQGIANISQPLFDYQATKLADDAISSAIAKADIVIFVSVAAVTFTQQSFAFAFAQLSEQPNKLQCFAVGKATKQALTEAGIKQVISPEVDAENSEGLLQLSQLNQVENKRVLIVRGNGGRELIANTLMTRGAQVSYIETYQRVWRTLPENIASHWQAQQINCIVVTSNDILIKLIKYLEDDPAFSTSYWRNSCTWLVASERIAITAQQFGLSKVINANSANSQIMCDTLHAMTCV